MKGRQKEFACLWISERGFDPQTCVSWAHHASAAPLWSYGKGASKSQIIIKTPWLLDKLTTLSHNMNRQILASQIWIVRRLRFHRSVGLARGLARCSVAHGTSSPSAVTRAHARFKLSFKFETEPGRGKRRESGGGALGRGAASVSISMGTRWNPFTNAIQCRGPRLCCESPSAARNEAHGGVPSSVRCGDNLFATPLSFAILAFHHFNFFQWSASRTDQARDSSRVTPHISHSDPVFDGSSRVCISRSVPNCRCRVFVDGCSFI